MNTYPTVIHELEDAIVRGPADRHAHIVEHITNLFIAGSERYSDEEIGLFDDVLTRLAIEIEQEARALLANRLAPINNAPPKVIRLLAFDDVIEVARPVLAQSERLDDPALVENARTKSQQHLLAISRRKSLSSAITDVLVERGDRDVVLSTVANGGAQLSEGGFAILLRRSDGDDAVAVRVGSRREIPPHLFLRLLATASHAVRLKLEAEHPAARHEIHQVVAQVARRMQAEARGVSRDYSAAIALIGALHASKRLDEHKLAAFAKAGKFEETTAALAHLCDLPLEVTERAMTHDRPETVLILAKAIGLSWMTAKAILVLRSGKLGMSGLDIEQCLANYERLKHATAEHLINFHRKREGAGGARPS